MMATTAETRLAPNSSHPPPSPAAPSTTPSTPTLLRIKRKRTDDPVEALIVEKFMGKDKRAKPVADARVFRLLESIDTAVKPTLDTHTHTETSNQDVDKDDQSEGASQKALVENDKEANGDTLHGVDKAVTVSPSHTRSSNMLEDSLAGAAFRQHSSMKRIAVQPQLLRGQRREVMASAKLAEARAARYRIVTQSRQQSKYGTLNIIDIQREEMSLNDEITCNLMPMVREYLTLSDRTPDEDADAKSKNDSGSKKSVQRPATLAGARHVSTATKNDSDGAFYEEKLDESEVYDVYYLDQEARAAAALRLDRVATLALAEGQELEVFMDDEEGSSEEDCDSDDSNAEDYYANDYPDEEDCEWEESGCVLAEDNWSGSGDDRRGIESDDSDYSY